MNDKTNYIINHKMDDKMDDKIKSTIKNIFKYKVNITPGLLNKLKFMEKFSRNILITESTLESEFIIISFVDFIITLVGEENVDDKNKKKSSNSNHSCNFYVKISEFTEMLNNTNTFTFDIGNDLIKYSYKIKYNNFEIKSFNGNSNVNLNNSSATNNLSNSLNNKDSLSDWLGNNYMSDCVNNNSLDDNSNVKTNNKNKNIMCSSVEVKKNFKNISGKKFYKNMDEIISSIKIINKIKLISSMKDNITIKFNENVLSFETFGKIFTRIEYKYKEEEEGEGEGNTNQLHESDNFILNKENMILLLDGEKNFQCKVTGRSLKIFNELSEFNIGFDEVVLSYCKNFIFLSIFEPDVTIGCVVPLLH